MLDVAGRYRTSQIILISCWFDWEQTTECGNTENEQRSSMKCVEAAVARL